MNQPGDTQAFHLYFTCFYLSTGDGWSPVDFAQARRVRYHNPKSPIQNLKSVPFPIIHQKRIEAQRVTAVRAFGYEMRGVEGFLRDFQAGGVRRGKAGVPGYPCNRFKYFRFRHKAFSAPFTKRGDGIIPSPFFPFHSVKPETCRGNNS